MRTLTSRRLAAKAAEPEYRVIWRVSANRASPDGSCGSNQMNELPCRPAPTPRSFNDTSPRAWGTHSGLHGRQHVRRFIPTGVGNSSGPATAPAPSSVHPHGRGELHNPPTKEPRRCGSSPRAWGTRRRTGQGPRTARFIPTGVGNSPSGRGSRDPRAVHPHGRGELIHGKNEAGDSGGSSPRAWGTPEGMTALGRSSRFIPTGVGNSRCRSASQT